MLNSSLVVKVLPRVLQVNLPCLVLIMGGALVVLAAKEDNRVAAAQLALCHVENRVHSIILHLKETGTMCFS